ncbi:MAG TPA: DUF6516 family protein, partial [Rhodopila sp.]|nr:DUF6516 family protein [Rhodopila sp.]
DLTENEFVEIVIWRVPQPVRGSTHGFEYRMAFISSDVCVVRSDNEAGKRDHAHIGGQEYPYSFTTVRALQDDYWAAVEQWRRK